METVSSKYKIPVRVHVVQGLALLGYVFVRQDQRILDMLCDDRAFFPLMTQTGIQIINKSSAVSVEILSDDFVALNRVSFPEDQKTNRSVENNPSIAEYRSRARVKTEPDSSGPAMKWNAPHV